MKGKLVIFNGESIDTSTNVYCILLDKVESLGLIGNKLEIKMTSGNVNTFVTDNFNEMGAIAEFVSAFINLEDRNDIYKEIKISY